MGDKITGAGRTAGRNKEGGEIYTILLSLPLDKLRDGHYRTMTAQGRTQSPTCLSIGSGFIYTGLFFGQPADRPGDQYKPGSRILPHTVLACGVNNVSTGLHVRDAGIATLFFHATDDGNVGIKNSKDAVVTINSFNPPVKAKLIEYTSGQHWIWGKVFSATERPWTGNESPKTVHEYVLMCTTDKAVDVPITTTPTGLVAHCNRIVKGRTNTA